MKRLFAALFSMLLLFSSFTFSQQFENYIVLTDGKAGFAMNVQTGQFRVLFTDSGDQFFGVVTPTKLDGCELVINTTFAPDRGNFKLMVTADRCKMTGNVRIEEPDETGRINLYTIVDNEASPTIVPTPTPQPQPQPTPQPQPQPTPQPQPQPTPVTLTLCASTGNKFFSLTVTDLQSGYGQYVYQTCKSTKVTNVLKGVARIRQKGNVYVVNVDDQAFDGLIKFDTGNHTASGTFFDARSGRVDFLDKNTTSADCSCAIPARKTAPPFRRMASLTWWIRTLLNIDDDPKVEIAQ